MSNKKDSIGDRMKEFYEFRTRQFLPRRTYTIIRLDGKAFHTYTKGLESPFDNKFIEDMDETAKYLCENIQGAKFAFVQSDEISILLTDFDKLQTDAWYDGNVQKITSVSASLATAKFNQLRPDKLAMFDSRVFTIPSSVEVENYFIWRQQDTVRNSISSLAQSLYSSKELHGVNSDGMQELCFQKGCNWDQLPVKLKRGRLIVRKLKVRDKGRVYLKSDPVRYEWKSIEPSIFTQERHELKNLVPILDND